MGKKWKYDLVKAHGDRFWELGDCVGEFLGGRKETNFVVERWGRVSYTVTQFVYESALGITRGTKLGRENSGFRKEPFLAAKIKIENCAVVGTFPGQGLGPGEDGRCFRR